MSRMTQEEYIVVLLDDYGYDTAKQRKDWLQLRFGKDFAAELSVAQRLQAIEMLKAENEPHNEPDEDQDW